MAPISCQDASSSRTSHCDKGHMTDNLQTYDLPISRRGLFFQDSAFENACEHLNNNMRRILQSWGETNFLNDRWDDPKHHRSDTLSRFRQLRSHSLKEDDQAVTVTSDATSHKIVMDVHDFMDGDVKVKVVGKEVVVEGRTETKTGNWSRSSNSFQRRFCLPPNTNVAAVSSVLSSDGILTVLAPLVVAAQDKGCTYIPITVEGERADTLADNHTNVTSSLSTNVAEKTTCTRRHEQQTQSAAAQQGRSHIIPIQVDGETNCHSQARGNTADSRGCDFKQKTKSHTDDMVESTFKNMQESVRQSQRAESFLDSSRTSSVTSQASTKWKSQAQPSPTQSAGKTKNIPINACSFLPITQRGQFFNDSFFAGLQQDFQNAINEVLGRWGEGSSATAGRDDTSRLGRYRQLREHNFHVESQAMTVTADQDSHKVQYVPSVITQGTGRPGDEMNHCL